MNYEIVLRDLNDYFLYIILKVIMCFLDQYNTIKYAFLFSPI